MKNLNLTLSLTEAGKCATKLAQGIDGPVYAMKMQNGKYICGLSFIIAIAGRSAFGDEFDTNATYEILVRLTELNTGNAIDLYGMTFNPKDYIVHSKGGTTYCYFNESVEINDIVLPTDPISANSKYYKIYPSYSMSADSKNSLEEKLQKETDLFLQNNAEALNHDVWTAAYTVNEWLCQNVTYTDEKNIQNGQYYPYNSIVAPLLRKEAICSGYAKTFAYLMNKAGYEAAYCTGYTNGGIYHAWNAIVYNGEITYIDSTYNASGNHMAYFCRNKEDLKERTENSIIWFSASDD